MAMKDIDFELIKAGGRDGEIELTRLIKTHEGYINKFANSYIARANREGKAVTKKDLEATATLGMIMSVKKYNPNKGKFLSWATNYMKTAIYEYSGLAQNSFYCENEQVSDLDTANYGTFEYEAPNSYTSHYDPNTGFENNKRVPICDSDEAYDTLYHEILDRIRKVLNEEEFTIFCRYRGLAGYEATDLPIIANELDISLFHAQCVYSHSLCELRIDDD